MLSETLGALGTDHYVNQKLGLKLDLPTSRETVLDMFDRIRKEIPDMDRFRRYEEELALESTEADGRYNWVALDRVSIRSGWVNPADMDEAYRLHRLILEVAPYFLSISPLDVDSLELMFGIDVESDRNRNEVIYEALFDGSPLGAMVQDGEAVLDAQPFVGFALTPDGARQAFVEVKSRTRPGEIMGGRIESDPISVYLTVRSFGPFRSLESLQQAFADLGSEGERLVAERVVPHVVQPIREALLG